MTNTSINLHKAQAEIVKSRKRFRVLLAGRRFGKTTLAVWELFGKAVSGDGKSCAYLSPTYQQSRDIAWRELIKICRPVMVEKNESRLEITVRTVEGGTSEIKLRGWESVDGLRGQAFDLLIIDEVASLKNFWVGWQEVLRPALTDRKGQVLFIGTPKGFNWFYDLYNTQGGDWQNFHFTSFDNPFIDPSEIEAARKELTEDRFAQEYLADFRKQEGLVYKEFNREQHIKDAPELAYGEKLAGVDFGFTNPTAILTIFKNNETYYVADEYYQTGKTEQQIADYIVAHRFSKVFPDPENPSAIKSLEDKYVNVMEVEKGKGSVQGGIDKVRQMFKMNRLIINPKCVNLIAELETYHYEEKKRTAIDEPELPKKEFDHALDALRYVLMSDDRNNLDVAMVGRVTRNQMQPRRFR